MVCFYRYLHFAYIWRSYKTCDKAMKYLSVFILSFFVIAGFFLASPAMAQEVTQTPVASRTSTITAPPPYEPSINLTGLPEFECLPEGTMPSGWGTVTPSTSWDLFCSDCYIEDLPTSTMQPSETPVPQPTWDGTGTPQPTWTVTATVTPSVTPSPTSTPFSGCATPAGTVLYWDSVFDGNLSVMFAYPDLRWYTLSRSCVPLQDVYDKTIRCTYDYDAHLNGIGMLVYFGVHVISPSGNPLTTLRQTVTSASGGYLSECGVGNNCPPYYDYGGAHPWLNTTYYALPRNVGGSVINTSLDTHIVFTTEISVSDVFPTPIVCNTPTSTPVVATATPDLNNYCAVVSDTSLDDSYFSYSGIVRTGQSCFDLGGPAFASDNEETWIQWWINDLWKSVGSPDMPYLAHICLVGIDIGVLTVFGVSVNLHIVAFFLGVALIIRNMFVS